MYSTHTVYMAMKTRNVYQHLRVCYKRVKWSRYRPGVAQRVGRGIALLFHDRGTRRGWVVSSTPRTHFTPGKDPVPILQETGWAPGPVWTGGKSRPHRDSITDRPAHSQSLYRLSYPAQKSMLYCIINKVSLLYVHVLHWCLEFYNTSFVWHHLTEDGHKCGRNMHI